MFRIIRTTTLNALQADSAALPAVQQELTQAKAEAEHATDSAIRAENVAEQQLRVLARAHADRFQAERERDEAVAQRRQDKTETDRQLAELREDFTRLRDAAADPDTGETVRAALAYRVLRDLYADAWAQGLLPKRPFDVIAAVMGFDTPKSQAAAAATN